MHSQCCIPWKTLGALALVGAGVALVAAGGLPGPGGGGDWPQYRHDPQSNWLNPGTFDAAGVAQLKPIWTFELGAPGFSQPAIVGDTVYLTSAIHQGKVMALDAATGHLKWIRNLSATLTTTGCGQFNPGIWDAPAVVSGVLYIGATDGKVYALDAATGATRWATQVAQVAPHGEFLLASPVVSTALGKLYIGTSSITDCDMVEGHLISVNLSDGSAMIHSVLPPGHKGASIWSSVTIDEQAGLIYVSTAAPRPTTASRRCSGRRRR